MDRVDGKLVPSMPRYLIVIRTYSLGLCSWPFANNTQVSAN